MKVLIFNEIAHGSFQIVFSKVKTPRFLLGEGTMEQGFSHTLKRVYSNCSKDGTALLPTNFKIFAVFALDDYNPEKSSKSTTNYFAS